MRALAVLLGLLLALPASAGVIDAGATTTEEACGSPCRITWSGGGFVIAYVRAVDRLVSQGRDVVLDGDCYSSCTLLVDLMAERGRACVTPRARFFIHQMTTDFSVGTVKMVSRAPMPYTAPLAAVVAARGGQPTEGWLEIPNAELRKLVRPC